MDKIDYTKYIIPTKLPIVDKQYLDVPKFETKDKIFIPTQRDVQKDKHFLNIKKTDFCALTTDQRDSMPGESMLIRNSDENKSYAAKIFNNDLSYLTFTRNYIPAFDAICPCLTLSLQTNIDEKFKPWHKLNSELVENIKKTLVLPKGNNDYATIKLGEYITNKVNDEKFSQLENLYQASDSNLKIVKNIVMNANTHSYENCAFETKVVPVFEINGERFARIAGTFSLNRGNVMWFKVEPLTFRVQNFKDLPREINPKGKNRTANMNLVCEKLIIKNIPTHFQNAFSNVWTNSTTRSFLNGLDGGQKKLTYFDEAKNSGNFTHFGGFLNDCFNLNAPLQDEYYLSNYDIMIKDNAFEGCKNIKKIHIPKNVRAISQNAFNGFDFKYAYKLKPREDEYDERVNDIVVSTTLPENLNDYDVIYIDSYKDFKWQWLIRQNLSNNFEFMAQMSQIVKDRKLKFDPAYFLVCADLVSVNERREFTKSVLELLKNGDFRFFMNEYKNIMPRTQYDTSVKKEVLFHTLCLASSLGAFSDEKVLDKYGNETNTLLCQKVCSFLARLTKVYEKQINYSGFIESIAPSTILPANQKLFKFLSSVGEYGEYQNIEMLLILATHQSDYAKTGIVDTFIRNFDKISNYRNDLDEYGKPKKLTWEQAIKKYYIVQEYGEDFANDKLMKEYAKFGIRKQEYEQAKGYFEAARQLKVPKHLLNVKLKEENEIENLINQIDDEFKKSEQLLEKAYKKQFNFEFLSKADPRNAIIGLYTNCCAILHGMFYGANIAKSTILKDDVQNIVITDSSKEIIAKGAMYLNREEGYCVINEFEISNLYRQSKQKEYYSDQIFKSFMRAIHAFVSEYDKENPSNPIRYVTVGEGFNKLILQSSEYADTHYHYYPIRHLPVPREYEFLDASDRQYVLYDRSKRKNIDLREFEEDAK